MPETTLVNGADAGTNAGSAAGAAAGAPANSQAPGTDAGAAGAATDGGNATGAAAGTDAGGAAKVGAPESYAAFTVPDGVKLEGDALTEVQTFAKSLNLTQEQAQKLVDRDMKTRQDADAALRTQVADVHKKWADESRANTEWGGDNLVANLSLAKKALTTFDKDGALAKGLEDTGAGNNPAMIGFLVRVGKAISEDKLVSGTKAPETRDARSFYPNSNHTA